MSKEVINLDEIFEGKKSLSPKENKLESYVGKMISIISIKKVDNSLIKKEGRETYSIEFLDSDDDKHSIMTAAKYIVKKLELILQICPDLATSESTHVAHVFVHASKSFGKYRNFEILSLKEASEYYPEEVKIAKEKIACL